MDTAIGIVIGLLLWFVVRCLVFGLYTIDQNQRGVKTRFGRAIRVPGGTTTLDDPIAEFLLPEERARYAYPQVRVIPPGGPYFKMPWEKIYKVSIATITVNMALDPENAAANESGTRLEAVTKDQLNTGLTGQIRYRVSESNLYAYLFGIKKPFVHVMGYFVSVLRQRIANFEAKPAPDGRGCRRDRRVGGGGRAARRQRDDGDLDQRPAQEPARPERIHGPGMPLRPGALRRGPGRLADHRRSTRRPRWNRRWPPSTRPTTRCRATSAWRRRRPIRSGPVPAGRGDRDAARRRRRLQPIRSLAAELSTLHEAGATTLAAYLRNVRLALYDKAQQVYLEAQR